MSGKPEISAVLLSMNEPTVERAVASIVRQSLGVVDLVRVHGVTPFHRALNEGAARVGTEYFLQVDADMILDTDCLARLAGCTGPTVGAVIGMLRDPLYGRVQAIKLLRTSEITSSGFPDSISPDTDFLQRMEAHGRYTVYALRHDAPAPAEWHTFGEHRPEYDPLYTFEKNKRDGRRIRHLGDADSVRYHLDLLHRSTHPCARIAEIGIAHGLFFDWEGDRQDGDCRAGVDFHFLVELLVGSASTPTARAGGGVRAQIENVATAAQLVGPAESVFRRSYALGTELARTRRADRFETALAARHRLRHPWAWLAQAALCRGLFVGLVPNANVDDDWRRLDVFTERLRATAPFRLVAEIGRKRVATLASTFGVRR